MNARDIKERIKEKANRIKDRAADKIKKRNITWVKAAPYFGALFALVLFICLSLKAANDTVNKRAEQNGIVTRFPTDNRYFFDGADPESGIVMSWYDNTVKLADGVATVKLDAEFYPVTAENRELSYTSSDTDCAVIESDGTITAKKPGSVEITVKNEHTGISAKAYLQIIQPVEGFYINNSSINMYITDSGVRIEPIIYPENSTNATIKWFSRDTSIVEVDQTGHLKPIATGMAEVVGTTADGGYTAKCFVNVINETIKAEKLTILNKPETSIAVGEKRRLIVTLLPSNARNKNIEWQSSDEGVVTVSDAGVIKGVMAGTATIYAKSGDGPYDSFEVTVNGSYISGGEEHYITMPGGITYAAYDMTLDEMAQKQMTHNPVYNDGNGLKSADINRVKMYVDPTEFSSGAYKYQFMDLSHYNGVSRESLERFLTGKGILSGKADVFISAARQYNVSEIYLVAHACLETGYGTSQLARGVNYNGVRVYNMFGIGAYDSDAVATGSNKAFKEGWTTPEAAIMGGAKWISENYINSSQYRQNTLYKMRWNPDNPGNHLYAGDVAWAVTQSIIMESIISVFPNASISYEVPVYAGSVAAVIDNGTSLSVTAR